MSYVGDAPWHGLGQELTEDSPIEVWAEQAGMDFTIESAPALYMPPNSPLYQLPTKRILYRNDSQAPLGFVSDRYKVVQPIEVLEFFRDLTEHAGFKLHTAGVLFGGAKYWALAKTGHSLALGEDKVDGYLFLSTACDGSMQTTAQFTSIRVVCNNTLSAALHNREGQVKLSHRTIWDDKAEREMKQALGIDTAWVDFKAGVERLADIQVSDLGAANFIAKIMGVPDQPAVDQVVGNKNMATVFQLFKGKGRGSEYEAANGTAWGLVNAVTEYADYFAGRSNERRFVNALMTSNNIKDIAFHTALAMNADDFALAA
jgi:phage/plasmid-like protein (TIGR03299 family)